MLVSLASLNLFPFQAQVILSVGLAVLLMLGLYYCEACKCIRDYKRDNAKEMRHGLFEYYSQVGRALLVAIVKYEDVGCCQGKSCWYCCHGKNSRYECLPITA